MLKPRILVTGATGKMVRASVRSCRCRAGLPIDLIGGDRYCIDDHKCGAFELGAPTADVLDVAGQPTEDFEAIARRYASLPPNQRTAAIRKAQGKKNPDDFPADSPEWHRVCEEFVDDVYVALGGDPNDMSDDFTFFELGYESEEAYQQALEEERRNQT